MISFLQTKDYRCLQRVSQPLSNFQVLVGPNASGKSTFLDALGFLQDVLTSSNVEMAWRKRSSNFHDLVWGRKGLGFEISVEAPIPTELQIDLQRLARGMDADELSRHNSGEKRYVQYYLHMQFDTRWQQAFIHKERLRLTSDSMRDGTAPQDGTWVDMDIMEERPNDPDTVLLKHNHFDYISDESQPQASFASAHDFGRQRSILANFPPDRKRFPVSVWFRDLLQQGVSSVCLNSAMLRKASPPGLGRVLNSDGGNLPWVVERLMQEFPNSFRAWVMHLSTALPDLKSIRVVEREDDRHKYLMLQYTNGVEIPSWMVSDGTLRLLALTILAYIPDLSGIFLIEEPENGIHPKAVESMYQSLRSIYGAQVLLATHSPIILSLVEPKDVLCFSSTEDGATQILSGDQHPALRDWRRGTNLGMLLAAGVLG